jgi:hypothetical protein
VIFVGKGCAFKAGVGRWMRGPPLALAPLPGSFSQALTISPAAARLRVVRAVVLFDLGLFFFFAAARFLAMRCPRALAAGLILRPRIQIVQGEKGVIGTCVIAMTPCASRGITRLT